MKIDYIFPTAYLAIPVWHIQHTGRKRSGVSSNSEMRETILGNSKGIDRK